MTNNIIELNNSRGKHMGKNYTRRRKPYDPAEQARKRAEEMGKAAYVEARRKADPTRWGVNRDAMQLAANADVQIVAADRTRVERARRFDVFALLHARASDDRPFPLAPVRRLQEAMAVLHKTTGEQSYDRVDNGRSTAVSAMSAARLEAGEEIRFVFGAIGPAYERLMVELCEPEFVEGRRVDWRGVVQRIFGETNAVGQGTVVWMVAGRVAEAYTAFDNEPRRRVA